MADFFRKTKTSLQVANFIRRPNGTAHIIVNNDFWESSTNGNATFSPLSLSLSFPSVNAKGKAIANAGGFPVSINLQNSTAEGKATAEGSVLNINSSFLPSQARGEARATSLDMQTTANFISTSAKGGATTGMDAFIVNTSLENGVAKGKANSVFAKFDLFYVLTGLNAGNIVNFDPEIIYAKSLMIFKVFKKSKITNNYYFKSKIK